MKYVFKLLLAFIMVFSLFACGTNEEKDKDEDKQEVVHQPKQEEDKQTQEAQEVKGNINLLTGTRDLDDKAVGKRPVAIVINNISYSLPQYGISDADIIYEFPVEAGVTRLLAFYADYNKIPTVCSIRSSRYFFIPTIMGYDAFYVHWGYYYPDEGYIRSLDFKEFEGLYNHGKLFGRDQNRLDSGYALEHTGVFYGKKMAKLLAKDGHRTDLKDEFKRNAFNFASEEITHKDACDEAKIAYASTYTTLVYDKKSKTYLKQHDGNPHMDQASKKQLAFKNVFILETKVKTINNEGRNSVDWSGNDKSVGYYLTNGTMQKIHWRKESETAQLKFYDENGKEIKVNTGKSYIAYTTKDSTTFK